MNNQWFCGLLSQLAPAIVVTPLYFYLCYTHSYLALYVLAYANIFWLSADDKRRARFYWKHKSKAFEMDTDGVLGEKTEPATAAVIETF